MDAVGARKTCPHWVGDEISIGGTCGKGVGVPGPGPGAFGSRVG